MKSDKVVLLQTGIDLGKNLSRLKELVTHATYLRHE